MKLEGLYTAIVTPFNSHGELDQEGLRRNLRYQLQNHVQGIIALGTTGEDPTLTSEEKKSVIKIAVEEVKGKAELLIGTGSYSTEQTIAATRQAQEMGADAALIVTPYYNRPTQEGLYRHFEAICQATSLPICVYNVQSRTGQNLQTETLQRLADLPTVKGVKEASGNIVQMTEILANIGKNHPNFKVLSGDDAFTFPLMALGGHGIISVASNLIPGPMQQFVQAGLKGDFATARQWHYQLLPFFQAIFIETNPGPIKAAMQLARMSAGSCRLPLCDLAPAHLQKLKQIFNTLPPSWYGQTKSPCC